MKTNEKNSVNAAQRRETRQTPKTIQKQAEAEKKKSKWTQQPKNPFVRLGPRISPADIIVDTQLNKIKVEHFELANTTKQERASPLPFETQDLEDAFPSVEGSHVDYSLPQETTTRPEEPRVVECLLESRFKNVPSLFDKDAADWGVQVQVEPVVNLEGDGDSVSVERGAEIACPTQQEAVSIYSSSTVDSCHGPSTVISSTRNKVSEGIAAKHRNIRRRGRPRKIDTRFWKERESASYYRGMEIKKNENGAYLCPLGCTDSDIINATKFVIIQHVVKFHSDSLAKHHCNRCSESFYYENDLMDHRKLRHSREDVKCDICGSFFPNLSALKSHKGQGRYCVEQNFREKLMTLCENGADINAKDGNGNTILHLAAYQRGGKEDIEYIVKKGGDWKLKNQDGQTVLHNAAVGGNPKVIKYLIDLGADVSLKDDSGATPFLALSSTKGDFKGSLDAFLDSGVNINEQDDEGNTLLARCVVSHARTRADLEYIVQRSRSWNVKK